MEFLNFKNEEKAIFALRSLYLKYGYRQYSMSKFEEYDLYLRNKNFLVSDNIITFTDTNGKLLALKPDVTLSIIKNIKGKVNGISKMFYNENVYRVSKGTQSFKEIMQAGLECIGDVDDYTIYEVIMLAAESLNTVCDEYVIDISHIGIVSALVDSVCKSEETKKEIYKCIGEKNLSGLNTIEKRENSDFSILKELIKTYGTLDKVMPFLKSLNIEETKKFEKIIKALESNGYKNKIRVDFSIISDTNYYNGFVFKGFINNIPASVLSGGQYDNLMQKMGREEKAIGFAVYLDMLESISEERNEYDVDVVILYDKNADINSVNDAIKLLSANRSSVMAQAERPEKIKYKQLVKLTEGGVSIIENT